MIKSNICCLGQKASSIQNVIFLIILFATTSMIKWSGQPQGLLYELCVIKVSYLV